MCCCRRGSTQRMQSTFSRWAKRRLRDCHTTVDTATASAAHLILCTDIRHENTALNITMAQLMLQQRPMRPAAAPGPWTTPTPSLQAACPLHGCWAASALHVHPGSCLCWLPAAGRWGLWQRTLLHESLHGDRQAQHTASVGRSGAKSAQRCCINAQCARSREPGHVACCHTADPSIAHTSAASRHSASAPVSLSMVLIVKLLTPTLCIHPPAGAWQLEQHAPGNPTLPSHLPAV